MFLGMVLERLEDVDGGAVMDKLLLVWELSKEWLCVGEGMRVGV